MSRLRPCLDIISVVAPPVATAIGGPASGLAVRALAEALDTDATAGAVATKLDGSPFSQIVAALRHAEAEFSGIDAAPVVRAEPMPSLTLQPEASAPVSPNGVLVDPTASVAKTLVAGILFVLCSLFVKDVATAQTLANALAPPRPPPPAPGGPIPKVASLGHFIPPPPRAGGTLPPQAWRV